jgi:hypothetical protein
MKSTLKSNRYYTLKHPLSPAPHAFNDRLSLYATPLIWVKSVSSASMAGAEAWNDYWYFLCSNKNSVMRAVTIFS